MPRSTLHPDVQLSVELSAIMSRNRFTQDPAPVMAELLEHGRDRPEILAAEVGSWIGYYDGPDVETLRDALTTAFPSAGPWIPVGASRHGTRGHST